MESDCSSLLPSVCKVLANPKLALPDDTSLEKLLDWFKELISHNDGQYIIQHYSCLLRFLDSMTESETVDPTIFSFTLKLAGLLAAKQDIFSLLKDRGVLQFMFDPDSWHKLDLWKNASVRCGWLQGLLNMLQHKQAIDFFCRKELIKLVLCLQNDESLFIASLTNQVLVHILNFVTLQVLNSSSESGPQGCSPVSTDCSTVTSEVISHVAKSLGSEEQVVILLGLRLLAVVLAQCREPLCEMFWSRVLEPLDVLTDLKDDFLTQPIMAVLQAAARSPLLIKPECRVEPLLDAMLCLRNTNECVQCAAVILHLENCHEDLKRKATDLLLLPLLCVTAGPVQHHGPDGCETFFKNQLSQRTSCVPLLTQSLSNIADVLSKKIFDDVAIRLITSSVITLLKICIGHHTSTVVEPQTFSHLIGCCKVQKASLDVLGSLSVYEENMDLSQEALTVLLLYLQCPDLHATVFKKTHQAALKWFSMCSPSPEFWKTVSDDLFPLLKKHLCDGRWEMRDSTLEFIMQLTATLKANSTYTEALHQSGMISELFTSLSDTEAYVRASAVSAVGVALTTSDLQPFNSLQEEAVTHLLTIIMQDTESFPRRAAVKVFTSWLTSPFSFTALHSSLSSVLSLGGNDFDWEVKLHTLELAEVLMENSLRHAPYSLLSYESCVKQGLNKLIDVGLFELLLKSLFDCDRPVSQKACELLLKLRTLMRETSSADHSDLLLEVSRCSWGEEMLHNYHKKQMYELNGVKNGDEVSCRQKDSEDCDPGWPKKIGLFKILELLDLEDMQHILSLSSDHVINSLQSVMEDILLAAQQSEENIVDCY